MSETAVLYEVRDHIATITLNRPQRMNSFSDELLTGWANAITAAAEDDDVRVVVVTGNGRAFCAGADLKAGDDGGRTLGSDVSTADRRNSLRFSVHRVPQALEYLDKPYIAAVNGAAVGAGMDVASMADIRIASDLARFGMTYVKMGIIPGDGGAWLLQRIVGTTRALELIWSGDIFDAQTALDMGYVSQLVPHDQLMDRAYAYAARLAAGPPIAIQTAKRLVLRNAHQTFPEGLEAAQAAMSLVQATEDAKEGPLAFREKRDPAFKGR